MLKELFGTGSPSLIESAYRDMAEMIDSAAAMFDIAVDALLNNKPLDADLERMDDEVDQGERMVRRTVLQHLVVNPQKDLTASLILASIVQDAERLGDFAAGLGDMIPLAKSERQGHFRDQLSAFAETIKPLFPKCREAFVDGNAESAATIIRTHTETKKRLNDFIASVADSDLTADMAVVYSNTARRFVRVSAHLANIASSVTRSYDQIRHGDEEA